MKPIYPNQLSTRCGEIRTVIFTKYLNSVKCPETHAKSLKTLVRFQALARAGVGNLFSAKGHLDIYKIIRGPYRLTLINLRMCLLYLVKHLINSPLM